ncbi:MAG: TonB C-terminal domain-containing protein [Betaproteobacteria bacterium]|nr:TonB C-terminal domain-containing protein [Betaproteobacteria bacterium]
MREGAERREVRRHEPGRRASIVLTVLVHAALVAVLIYGLAWRSEPPPAVEVGLVRPEELAPAPKVAPEPPPEPPKPEPKPEPPPPPKPAPKVEPPKPDIAIKEEKKKPKDEPKKEPPREEPKPKKEPPKKEDPRPKAPPEPPPDLTKELLKRETDQLARSREAQRASDELAHLAQSRAASALQRTQGAWVDKIRSKIRGNLLVPPGVSGNPEAEFDVRLLPDGSVLEARLRKSTGNAALDGAIERAIAKSSPLPKPDDPAAFVRDLHLKFRPLAD